MNNLVWTPSFKRSYKQFSRQHPFLHNAVMVALKLMQMDPFYPSLKTHKLHGTLQGLFACSINYEIRIVFDLIERTKIGDKDILLINIGTHEEVY